MSDDAMRHYRQQSQFWADAVVDDLKLISDKESEITALFTHVEQSLNELKRVADLASAPFYYPYYKKLVDEARQNYSKARTLTSAGSVFAMSAPNVYKVRLS